MPTCYMLIGVPGSGKSTWIAKQPFDWTNTVIASTDNYVEKIARERGKTYSEVFDEVMPDAVRNMAEVVTDAVQSGHNIVWDQTSTTRASRAKKFRMLRGYKVIAVVFPTPPRDELQRRLSGRVGKNIPSVVLGNMIKNWEEPTEDEGFDQIIHVR